MKISGFLHSVKGMPLTISLWQPFVSMGMKTEFEFILAYQNTWAVNLSHI